MTHWWTASDAGLYTGIAGLLAGLAIGLVVTGLRVLAPSAVARGPLIGALYVLAFSGGLTLGAGILGALVDQPAHVWLPLVGVGGVLAVAGGVLIPITRLAYRRAADRRSAG